MLFLDSPQEAEPFFREALEGKRRVLGDDHAETLVLINDTGNLLSSMGRLQEAESFFREVLTRRRRALGEDHPHTLFSLDNMCGVLMAMRRFEEAEQLRLESFRGRLDRHGPGDAKTVAAIERLVAFYTTWDEADPGKGHEEKAAEWRKRLSGKVGEETAEDQGDQIGADGDG